MGISFGGRGSQVVLEAVASVVELADVAADVVSYQEAATRVLFFKFFNVEDKVIKEYVLFPVSNRLIKFLSRHSDLIRFE